MLLSTVFQDSVTGWISGRKDSTSLLIKTENAGLDWEEVLEQRALERKRIAELGLPNPYLSKNAEDAARILASLPDEDLEQIKQVRGVPQPLADRINELRTDWSGSEGEAASA